MNSPRKSCFWIELVGSGRFAYDHSDIYGEATTFVMTGENLKYLCAMLNSKLIRWFLEQIAPTSGMGTLRWKKVYVHAIPIPRITAAKQRPFISWSKASWRPRPPTPDADTSEQEEEIDWLVYDLYGLTDEETAVVADLLWDGPLSEEDEDAALARAMGRGAGCRTGQQRRGHGDTTGPGWRLSTVPDSPATYGEYAAQHCAAGLTAK